MNKKENTNSSSPEDVLKRLVTGVPDTTVDLHRPVRGIAAKPVSDIVAHGNLVRQVQRDIGLGNLVHLCRGLEDQPAEHGGFRVELDERPLDRLVGCERLSERLALLGVLDGFGDAVFGGTARRGSLTDPVLVDKVRRDQKTVVELAKESLVGDPDVLDRDERVVRGHVEGPEVLLDLEAGGVDGDDKGRDTLGGTVAARGTAEDKVVGGDVHSGVPHFRAVDDPSSALGVADGAGFHLKVTRPSTSDG